MSNSDDLPMVIPPKRTWTCGRIIDPKRPLLPTHVWAIRIRLELAVAMRDLALFNMEIGSKLRGYHLVLLKVADISAAGVVKERASALQSKARTGRSSRNHRKHASVSASMDQTFRHGWSRNSLAWSVLRSTAHLQEAIRQNAKELGQVYRFKTERVWNALNAPHQGRSDLQKDRQSAGADSLRAHLDRRSTQLNGYSNPPYLNMSEGNPADPGR